MPVPLLPSLGNFSLTLLALRLRPPLCCVIPFLSFPWSPGPSCTSSWASSYPRISPQDILIPSTGGRKGTGYHLLQPTLMKSDHVSEGNKDSCCWLLIHECPCNRQVNKAGPRGGTAPQRHRPTPSFLQAPKYASTGSG